MEQGQHPDETHPGLLLPKDGLTLGGVGHHIAMGQHGTFGQARCAAGVLQDRRVILRIDFHAGRLGFGLDEVRKLDGVFR